MSQSDDQSENLMAIIYRARSCWLTPSSVGTESVTAPEGLVLVTLSVAMIKQLEKSHLRENGSAFVQVILQMEG